MQKHHPASTTVTVLNTAVIVEGKLTNYQLPSPTIAIVPNPLPANQISHLILTLDRCTMPLIDTKELLTSL